MKYQGLQDLLGKVDEKTFLELFYEKEVACFEVEEGLGSRLFSAEMLEQYLFTAMPWTIENEWRDAGMLVALAPSGGHRPAITSAEEAMALYAAGHTLILPAAQRRWAPLAEFCSALSESMLAHVEANVYLTPRGSQGFLAHYDTHDVILLQVEGSKAWRVRADDRIQLPPQEEGLRDEFYAIDRVKDIAGGESLVLQADSSLYIPRGVIHEGIAQDSHSLHITFGFHATTWYRLIRGMVLDAMVKSSALRKNVPHEVLCDLDNNIDLIRRVACEAIENADPAGTWRFLYERSGAIVPGGSIKSINALGTIGETTSLRIKAGCNFFWSEVGRRPWVTVTGRRISIPIRSIPYLEFVSTHDTFRPVELPETLPGESRVNFCRWLTMQGIAVIDE